MGTPHTPDTIANPPDERRLIAPIWHTVVFVVAMLAFCALQFTGHTLHGSLVVHRRLLAVYGITILFELLLVAYIWFLGLRPTHTRLRDLIGGKWARPIDVLRDMGVAVVFSIVVAASMIALGIALGPNRVAHERMKALAPQSGAEFICWVALSITAGFCEELIFRGYLQKQLSAISGSLWLAVVSQALVFGSIHMSQGWKGAVAISVYGALFGILAIVRKSLRPGMIQHAGYDALLGVGLGLLLKYRFV
jgi:hypothetical protein